MSPVDPIPTSSRPARSGRGRRLRLIRRAGVVTAAGALFLAGPAGAHPFVRGGELPVDSLATMTLAMAHGCDSEASAEGAPTTEVSLEVPAWLRVVDVPGEEGWVVELEEDDADALRAVTWTSDGAQELAPEVDLEVVATGDVGDERYLSVFQACGEFAYRWVGTPDDPADDPAVRVTLTEADTSSPPPPEPEPAEAASSEAATTSPDADAADDPVEDVVEDATGDEAGDAGPETTPLAAEEIDRVVPAWLLPVTVVLLGGGIAFVLVARPGRDDAGEDA